MSEVNDSWNIKAEGNSPKWLREGGIGYGGKNISLEDLRNGKKIVVQAILDQSEFPEAGRHFRLLSRDRDSFRVGEERMLQYFSRKANHWKDIGVLESHEDEGNFAHTLLRELVIILKGYDDAFTTEYFSVNQLHRIILRCANDRKKRAFIAENKAWARGLGEQIHTGQKLVSEIDKSGRIVTHTERQSMMQIETASKQFYEECRKVFGFKPIDSAVISTLSWDWKNPYTRRGFQYTCWCWVIISTIFSVIQESK